MEPIGIGIIVLFVIFDWMAWKSNKQSDINWERMRRELVPVPVDNSPMGIKTFYSQSLLKRLSPALDQTQRDLIKYRDFDSGYSHSMVFEVRQ